MQPNFPRKLISKIGDLDIEDVHNLAKQVISSHDLDSSRVGLFGGSHGGFITAHLLGKYPVWFLFILLHVYFLGLLQMVSFMSGLEWFITMIKKRRVEKPSHQRWSYGSE